MMFDEDSLGLLSSPAGVERIVDSRSIKGTDTLSMGDDEDYGDDYDDEDDDEYDDDDYDDEDYDDDDDDEDYDDDESGGF